MFWICAIGIVTIEALGYALSPVTVNNYYYDLLHIQLLLVALCGALASSIDTIRLKSGSIAVFIIIASIVLIDFWKMGVNDHWKFVEISFYYSLIIWSFARGYDYPSDNVSKNSVCLCFYVGYKGTMLMRLLGLFGLPMNSICVIAEDLWLKPVLSTRKLEIHNSNDIIENDYVIINTGIKVDDSIKKMIYRLEGSPSASIGSLGIRSKCIVNIKPLLFLLGDEWKVSTIFQHIPSIYFYKAIKNRRLNHDKQ